MSAKKIYLFYDCDVCGSEWRCWAKESNPTIKCRECGSAASPYESVYYCKECDKEWCLWTDPYDESSDFSVCTSCGAEVPCDDDEEEEVECESRQFVCYCRNRQWTWWDTVPSDNPTSRCTKCKTWRKALDRMEEFGIGKFTCLCGNVFYGRIRARDKSRCFRCQSEVSPEIREDYQHKLQGQPRSRNRHQCSWCRGKGHCKIYDKMSAYD